MLNQALILTSHREYAQTLRQGLLKYGHEKTRVDVEVDAERAMQLAPRQYDLILLDIVLDTMDGLQLLQLIKQQAPATKFILVSDSADETTRAVAYQNGADFFLERPRDERAYALALEAIRGLFKSTETTVAKSDGTDEPVNITDIIQMRCLSGDSVLLLVKSEFQSGDIFIFRGEIFHAQYPGKSGEAAFREMIAWDDGLLRIKAIKLTNIPPRTIEVSYRQLLEKEAARPEKQRTEPLTSGGELFVVPSQTAKETAALSVVQEAPPLPETALAATPAHFPDPQRFNTGQTPLPPVNSHWMVNLTGELLEGSQVSEPDRCAFITSFIYRKLADVAVALEVDYFSHVTLLGPHLQQVLVADNIGVRHAVFDTAWTTEEQRVQYVKWCCEQSF
jgi:DNA-binding response OmpR family regulator